MDGVLFDNVKELIRESVTEGQIEDAELWEVRKEHFHASLSHERVRAETERLQRVAANELVFITIKTT